MTLDKINYNHYMIFLYLLTVIIFNIPKSKEIFKKLYLLQKKNTLMKEYSLNKEKFSELVLYQKNYNSYMDKEVER